MKETMMIIIGLVLIMLILYILIKLSNKFRETCYSMFLFAEHEVIKGKKMDYVVNQIYDLLPTICRVIPKSTYKKLIQKIFDEVKNLLDDGKIN